MSVAVRTKPTESFATIWIGVLPIGLVSHTLFVIANP